MDTPPPEFASQRRASTPSAAPVKIAAALALLLSLAGAFVVFANCKALGLALGPSLGVAAAVLIVLPGAWHLFAERSRRITGQGGLRLVLRCFSVNALVAASALASLGPSGLWTRLRDAVPQSLGAKDASEPEAPAEPASRPVAPGEGLETFVPADAAWVLSLSGSPGLLGLLGAQASETQEKLEAMKKCHIDLAGAQVVMASRAADDLLVLVRAPGVSDEGNLYCLVGALGAERLVLRFDKQAERTRFTAEGLIPNTTVTFSEVADNTLLMVSPAWRDSVEQRLASRGPNVHDGLLSQPLARLDRQASVWAASVTQTPQGARDLALHIETVGSQLFLRATATPPAKSEQMAKLEITVPLDFARQLPQAALWQGAKGLWSVMSVTDAPAP